MTAVAVGRESAPVRAMATTVAAYEIIALWTDLPTITRLKDKYPPLGAAIVGVVVVHFYWRH